MRLLTTVLLLVIAVPVAAQEQEIRDANLPRELEWRLLRMYEGDARRYTGDATIGATEVVRGGVAAMGGSLRVAGRVEGDLAMVNGDVFLERGSSVTGDVMVVGGEVRMAEDAAVGGSITAYGSAPSRWSGRDRDREVEWEWPRRRRADRWSDRGFSRLTLRAGSSYNRVEGLPVMFGPIIQTAGPNPLRVEALAIWRTESGTLDTDRMGYQVRAEQFLGGDRRFSLGGSLFSVVDPMDRWQVTDLEASLAAVVFHDDFRDYAERTGWSAFARHQPARGVDARVEYRQERHGPVAAGDPWTLFDRSSAWRLQPMAAEGDVRILAGSLELDRRDDRRDPRDGWYGRVSLDRALGGELTRPVLVGVLPDQSPEPAPVLLPARDYTADFTTAFVDVRRYAPIGDRSQLGMRIAGGGALSETALPPQFQHTLGGLGTLPGFGNFHADCGARAVSGEHDGERFYPSYGCDRFALAQAEYRGRLSLDFGIGEPDYDSDGWWHGVDIDTSPTWVVFLDAGRGWAYGDTDVTTGTLYDVGAGFLIGRFGIYAAIPLNGGVEQEPRFFVRLGRRF